MRAGKISSHFSLESPFSEAIRNAPSLSLTSPPVNNQTLIFYEYTETVKNTK